MKTAVITGAGSGIGQAVAHRLAEEGHHIVVLDFDTDAGSKTAEAIKQSGGSAECIGCDVSDTESVAKAFGKIKEVHILVNNAGIAAVGNVETCTPDELDKIYSVNVKGIYHCLHFAIPKMLESGSGSIVNLASIASKVGIQDRFAYSMSKGAALTMTLSIAATILKPEKEMDYRLLHQNPWQGIIETMGACEIPVFDIFLTKIDGKLIEFFYFDYVGNDLDSAFKKMAADPITQRWWKHTDPCQSPLPGAPKGNNWRNSTQIK